MVNLFAASGAVRVAGQLQSSESTVTSIVGVAGAVALEAKVYASETAPTPGAANPTLPNDANQIAHLKAAIGAEVVVPINCPVGGPWIYVSFVDTDANHEVWMYSL